MPPPPATPVPAPAPAAPPGRNARAAGGEFHAEVEPSVRRLYAALHDVVAALPEPVRQGTDLERQLGLGHTLAWRIHSFLCGRDILAAAAQLPGRITMRKMLSAAAAKGVSASTIADATAAFEAFEACAVRHAGSRALFSLMLNRQGTDEPSALEMQARREAFRGMSYLYGVQMAISARCFILHPGASPDHYDYASINSSVGLQVNRPVEKLCVGRFGHNTDHDPARVPTPAEPVVETSLGARMLGGVPILTEFSSSPLPRFISDPRPKGAHEVSISGQQIGRTGAVTFHLAERWPDAAPRDEELGLNATVLHPTEVLLHDVLLAPGIAQTKGPPHTGVYGGAHHETRLLRRETDRMDVHARSEFMGVGVDALRTTDLPRHVEMLRYVCGKMGWDADAFDVYRCRIEYPVLHALVAVTFPKLGDGDARA